MEKPIHTQITEKPTAKIEYYKSTETMTLSHTVSLKVEAPTTHEASTLFTEKMKEVKLE